VILFVSEVVPGSGKIWISSYGAILDDARSEFWIIRIISESALTIFLMLCIELGVNKGLESIKSHFSKKTLISRYGAIRAEKCRITDSIRICAETTPRILPICETLKIQVILFVLEVIPGSGKIWSSSYGAIQDDARSELWIIRTQL